MIDPKLLAPLAADWGAVLLASGAEIRQVEEGLYDLFAAQGCEAEVFVLLKGIFLTCGRPGDDRVSQIRHVRGRAGVDLARLERALDLAPDLGRTDADPADLRARLDALAPGAAPRRWVLPLAAAATAGVYSLFFGGSLAEAGAATVWAAAVQAGRPFAHRLPALAEVFAAAAFLALGALAVPLMVPGADPVRVVTGEVMILIPGVALVNGIRDVLHGDTVSSLYRLADAGLQTAAIAGATALVFTLGWPHG